MSIIKKQLQKETKPIIKGVSKKYIEIIQDELITEFEKILNNNVEKYKPIIGLSITPKITINVDITAIKEEFLDEILGLVTRTFVFNPIEDNEENEDN
jgi:hypothetical protein